MTGEASTQGLAVWERVWQHVSGEEKERARLQREEAGVRWAVLSEAFTKAFGRIAGLRTIELGAGQGDVSVLLARRGARVTLVDFCQTALDLASARLAREGLAAECTRADLFAAGDLGGTYDAALSFGVIEHFRGPDRLRAVRAHVEVLRPGGLAVISVPYAGCVPYRLWKAYLELRGWWPYGMERPYSRRALAGLARSAGLVDVRLVGTAFLQSLGDHLCRPFLRRRPAWTDWPCPLDTVMGLNLMLLGRKPPSDDRGEPG